MDGLFVGFLCASIALIILSLCLRLSRQKIASHVCEVLSYVSFLGFTCRWTYLFAELNDLTLEKVMYLLLFGFALVLLIYKIVIFIKYRSL